MRRANPSPGHSMAPLCQSCAAAEAHYLSCLAVYADQRVAPSSVWKAAGWSKSLTGPCPTSGRGWMTSWRWSLARSSATKSAELNAVLLIQSTPPVTTRDPLLQHHHHKNQRYYLNRLHIVNRPILYRPYSP